MFRSTDDSILVFGQFTRFRGQPATNIVRLLPDGRIEAYPKLKADNLDEFTLATIQSDGKVLAFGRIHSGTVYHSQIVRFNADGSDDTTYTAGISTASHLAIQPDNRVVISGATVGVNTGDIRPLIRLNTDGTVDSSFKAGAATAPGNLFLALVNPVAIRVLGNGKLLVQASYWLNNMGQPHYGVVLLNPDGTCDPTYNIATSGTLIDARPDGTAYVLFQTPQGTYVVQRLSPAGVPDPAYTAAVPAKLLDRPPFAGTLLPDGRLLMVSPADLVPGHALFNADGSVAADYDPERFHGGVYLYNVIVTSDGREFIAGEFNQVGDVKNVVGFAEFNRLFSASAIPSSLPLPTLQGGSLQFTFPAGYTLQGAAQLGTPDWTTLATQSPASIPLKLPAQFFRLSEPQP
jgi:uncharacterized delta-60 repeat protein